MERRDMAAGKAATYWDANRSKATDPAFWMAHPVCRRAINRRISGNPHEWPLDWFRRVFVRRPLERALTFGCGLGSLERQLVRTGVVRRIDAFDISPESLRDARAAAEREGLEGIHYGLGDFNDPHLRRRAYDAVFFHQSLHHVSALERLFRRMVPALRPGGLLYAEEYVGPSRNEWTPADLQLGQAVLDLLPADARRQDRLRPPVQPDDPSEAVRSSEVPRFIRRHFDILAWRPYGGQVADLVFPLLREEWARSEAGVRAVGPILEIEEHELRVRPESTHYVVVVGRRGRPFSQVLPRRRTSPRGEFRLVVSLAVTNQEIVRDRSVRTAGGRATP